MLCLDVVIKRNSLLKKDMGYVYMFMCVLSFMLHEGAFGDNAKMDTLTFFCEGA